MGEGRGVYRVLLGRSEGKRPLGRPWVRWILKWILKKCDVMARTGLIWLRIGAGGGRL
jgi:hypothetical protein